jgi:ribosomal protein L7/L12
MNDAKRYDVTLQLSDEEHVEVAQLLARLRKDAEVRATSPRMNEEERALVRADHKVDAIKTVRNRLGCTLMTARDIVEAG